MGTTPLPLRLYVLRKDLGTIILGLNSNSPHNGMEHEMDTDRLAALRAKP